MHFLTHRFFCRPIFLGFFAGVGMGRCWRFWVYAAIGLALFAVLLELGQLFLSRRSFTLADIGFGWLGSALGLLLAWMVSRLFASCFYGNGDRIEN